MVDHRPQCVPDFCIEQPLSLGGLQGTITSINGSTITLKRDNVVNIIGTVNSATTYTQAGKTIAVTDLKTGEKFPITLPSSNVLQFILEDGSKISARPSGTEPKIKFYFSLKESFSGAANYSGQVDKLDERIKTIQQEIGL